MYERFTDRARKVMQLAKAEAQRLNHEYIGTEHILLGIIEEGSGVAATVMKERGVNFNSIRDEVDKIVQRGPDPEPADSPDPGGLRGWITALSLALFWLDARRKRPQTPTAKHVIEYAMREARNLNHGYVGTEHLLLGLLIDRESVSYHVLTNLGLELHDVREEILDLLGQEPSEHD